MRSRLALLGALALTLSACGKVEPLGPPQAIEASEAEALLVESADLDGKRISLEGYIGFDNGPKGEAIAMGPELTTQPMGRGDRLIRFEAKTGTGPNELNLHEIRRDAFGDNPNIPQTIVFDMNKTTYQDAQGAPHPLRTRLRVTGRLIYAHVRGVPIAEDDTRSHSGRRFHPRLVDVTLEATS